jgi:vacuolar-type H+-ATPase subunit H
VSTDYTNILKKIKEAEETGNRLISEKKKGLEAELFSLEKEADKSIADAKAASDSYVESEAERARSAAQKDADALLAATKKRAEALSSKTLSKKQLREIIDEVLFSEFKGD